MSYDIIIKNGLYFDGSGTPARSAMSASATAASTCSASARWMRAAARR